MKKKTWIILLLLIYFIIAISSYLLLTQAIIYWKAILIEVLLLLLFIVVLVFFSYLTYKNLIKTYNQGNYDLALKKGLRYVKLNPDNFFKQNTYLTLALIYFLRDDYSQFNLNLEKIKMESILSVKYFWKTIYSLLIDDREMAETSNKSFMEFLSKINKSYPYAIYEKILLNIFSFIKTNDPKTKSNLMEIAGETSNGKIKQCITYLLVHRA